MFNLEKQDSLLVITLSGKVTADEVTAFYDGFEKAIEGVERTGLVVDLTGFDDMTGDAIARDIPLEMGLLDEMGKFPKIAIVSGKEFISATLQAVNPLIPMIDMRVFGPDEVQAAKTFAADLPAKKSKSGKGIFLMEQSTPEVMAFEVDGYIDDDEMEVLSKDILKRLEDSKEFSALVKLTSFGGFDAGILTDGSFFKMKLGSIQNLKKYAIVTDEGWMKPLLGFAGAISGLEMKLFSLADEQAAWNWVKS